MYKRLTTPESCELVDGEKRLRIAFVTPAIVHVSYIKGDAFLDTPSEIATHPNRLTDFSLSEDENAIHLATTALQIEILKYSGSITFRDAQGNLLQQEPKSGGKFLTPKDVFRNEYDQSATVSTGQSIDGARAESEPSQRVFDRHAFEAKLEFTFAKQEALFGLGSHEEGYGNLRGKSQQLYQQNMKAVVPCVVSSKGYGLLLDCSSQMVFHDDAYGSYFWAECVDQLDYYFIGGGNASAVARNYYELTGAPPMLPRWAFGYIQSKERYVTPEEIISVAREYRRREIPLDLMVLDWKSWPDGAGWGQKSFDPVRFPNPTSFIDELHALDVKLMVSIWPIMSGECPNQKELRARGQMLGNQSTYNAFDPAARQTYWEQARDGLFSHGVDAWWCDCTEPFEADWAGAVKPEPHLRLQINSEQAKRYIDEGNLIAYSLYHSRGVYEGQRSATNEKRVFNLTRSSHAGQHRYSAPTWSGDICATWETLRRSIPEGVNFCATGEPYWTVDIGAFFIKSDPQLWFWRGDYEDGCRGLGPMSGTEPIANDHGCTDFGYWELYTRWLQYACFLPLFRSHGTDAAREIWRFGDEGNRFYDIIARYIRLRYQLIPYIYSVASCLADQGLALLRPVAMRFPSDKNTFDITDQYLFGPSLMVCPVTRPMYFDRGSIPITGVSESRSVYLPAGQTWYDFWSNSVYEGGQSIAATAPLETIPVFAPAGSIVPLGPVTQHSSAATEGTIHLHVFAGANASFLWYEDAGDSYAYEIGECARVSITWHEDNRILQFDKRDGAFPGLIPSRTFQIVLHTPIGCSEHSITYYGSTIEIIA